MRVLQSSHPAALACQLANFTPSLLKRLRMQRNCQVTPAEEPPHPETMRTHAASLLLRWVIGHVGQLGLLWLRHLFSSHQTCRVLKVGLQFEQDVRFHKQNRAETQGESVAALHPLKKPRHKHWHYELEPERSNYEPPSCHTLVDLYQNRGWMVRLHLRSDAGSTAEA